MITATITEAESLVRLASSICERACKHIRSSFASATPHNLSSVRAGSPNVRRPLPPHVPSDMAHDVLLRWCADGGRRHSIPVTCPIRMAPCRNARRLSYMAPMKRIVTARQIARQTSAGLGVQAVEIVAPIVTAGSRPSVRHLGPTMASRCREVRKFFKRMMRPPRAIVKSIESRAPAWRDEVTLRSVEMFTEYEPGCYIGFINPTPLMMVVALGDHLTVADEALAAYERALEPKRLVILPSGHFDAYVAGFDLAAGAATDWFVQHLRP